MYERARAAQELEWVKAPTNKAEVTGSRPIWAIVRSIAVFEPWQSAPLSFTLSWLPDDID
jgi:hypothetical protein